MRILFDINHPADVHQFKHLIRNLKGKGNHVIVTARNKECTHTILNHENIKFIPRKGYTGILGKTVGMILNDLFLVKVAKKESVDLLVGSSGNCYIAHAGFLLRKPSIVFDDTEHSTLQNKLTFPFATVIATPSSYSLDLGKKQRKYNGFKELAFLRPNLFKPEKEVLKKYGIKGKFFLIRLVSWDASHDFGKRGISMKKVIETLQKEGKVIISSETKLPSSLQKLCVKSPTDLHPLLYHAKLVISEGASTATEAALMGTPTIYANELPLGYVRELEKEGLIVHAESEKKLLEKIPPLLLKKTKNQWRKRKSDLISQKVDVVKWMTNLIGTVGAVKQ